VIIKRIKLKNFLSFENAEINLSDDINYFVGPNGAGKSNIIRALNFIVFALDDAPYFKDYKNYKIKDNNPEIELGIKLSQDEIKIFADYFIYNVKINYLAKNDRQNLIQDDKLKAILDENRSSIEKFFEGLETIKLEPSKQKNYFDVSFVFNYNDKAINYKMYDFNGSSSKLLYLYSKKPSINSIKSLIDIIADYIKMEESSTNVGNIINYMINLIEEKNNAIGQIDSEKSIRDLLYLNQNPDLFSGEVDNLMKFLEFLNIESNDQTLSYKRLLGCIYNLSLVQLKDDRPLKITTEVKVPPPKEYFCGNIVDNEKKQENARELKHELTYLTKQDELPQIIYDIKNNNIEQYIKLREMFKKLYDNFSFDVKENNKDYTIIFKENNIEIPMSNVSAGMIEALYLLVAFLGLRDKITLLDEPALHLHPSMQKKIIKLIEKEKGNYGQVLLITHSPYLISSDVNKLYYVNRDENGFSYINNIGEKIDKLSENDISEYINNSCKVDKESIEKYKADIKKEFVINPKIKAGLFSKLIIIMEGETEEIAIPSMLRQLGCDLDSLDIFYYSVGGSGNIIKHMIFWEKIKVPVFAIADPFLSDNNSNCLINRNDNVIKYDTKICENKLQQKNNSDDLYNKHKDSCDLLEHYIEPKFAYLLEGYKENCTGSKSEGKSFKSKPERALCFAEKLQDVNCEKEINSELCENLRNDEYIDKIIKKIEEKFNNKEICKKSN
jgi:predicted ATP-dependent endonuclease of OLD family